MSLDEFLAWERRQSERFEFVDGVATMRVGQTLGHGIIIINLLGGIRTQLQSGSCRVYATMVKIIANGTVRYPDLSVVCQAVSGKDDIVPEPVVIIEVLSPTTARVD